MATRGALYPCRQLVWAAHPAYSIVPRRSITYTRHLRAQEKDQSGDNSKTESGLQSVPFGSFKRLLLGGKSAAKPKITRTPTAPQQREGSLSSSSIFAEDEPGPKLTPDGRTPTRPQAQQTTDQQLPERLEDRNPERLAISLDPRPKARIRWERKMITRSVRRRGRLTKKEVIKLTERETLLKSEWMKSSIKKLGSLARQIAGRNIDDAIVQMRFSKKGAAMDVMEYLKHAKNVAIARHGMGLGRLAKDKGLTSKPVTITLKSGKRMEIADATSIYIAQAWVSRGPFDISYDYRAKGGINTLHRPHTGLSVLLKEEKTRIREWQEREAKAQRQRESRLWTQLPDRKISQQNQYYSW